MRKFFLRSLLLIGSIAFLGNCWQEVPAGKVGVKVYLLGQSKGVDTEVLPVGRYWIGWNEDLYLFPTYIVNKVWTADKREDSPENQEMTFQTEEGLSVSADVGISYSIDPAKAALLFQKFHKGIDEITDVYMRSYVRDTLNRVASNYTVEDTYGPKKAEIMDKVTASIKHDMAPYGITVERLYWVGAIRLPQQVLDALNAKIAATQQAQQRENEVAEAKAQAEKKIAEARGDAESLRLRASAITQTNLEYERLQIMRIVAENWDGQLPKTMPPGATLPFIQLPK